MAEQNFQTVFRLGTAGFQGWDLRTSLFQIGAGLLHIQSAGQTSLCAPLSELQGFGLGSGISLGDLQPGLETAQLHVVKRDFGDERNLHVVQAGFAGFQIGLSGFLATSKPAEHVRFPTGVEASVV